MSSGRNNRSIPGPLGISSLIIRTEGQGDLDAQLGGGVIMVIRHGRAAGGLSL